MKQIALLAIITMGSGCMTVLGKAVGSNIPRHSKHAELTGDKDNWAAEGILIGILADIALGVVIVRDIAHDLETYTPPNID